MARTGRPPTSPAQRRTAILSRVIEGDGCWTWAGSHRSYDGRPMYARRTAYRAVWQELVGPPPPVLHHECENHLCVRPGAGHVVALEGQAAHMRAHGAGGDWGQAAKTHCPAGHPYDDANTYRWRNERGCRACRRAAGARARARRSGVDDQPPAA